MNHTVHWSIQWLSDTQQRAITIAYLGSDTNILYNAEINTKEFLAMLWLLPQECSVFFKEVLKRN